MAMAETCSIERDSGPSFLFHGPAELFLAWLRRGGLEYLDDMVPEHLGYPLTRPGTLL